MAVYFEPDQSVITKITKDAKMTWSDKISWVSFVFLFVSLLKMIMIVKPISPLRICETSGWRRHYQREKSRARPGFEPGTTRTLSEYHTPRPTSQLIVKQNKQFISQHFLCLL